MSTHGLEFRVKVKEVAKEINSRIDNLEQEFEKIVQEDPKMKYK